jgi:TRAP-type mannitol/chloroaromatic compound transport system substrate-binding protein
VLLALRRTSEKVLEEAAAADPMTRRALDSMRAFRAQAKAWHAVSEEAYFATRG